MILIYLQKETGISEVAKHDIHFLQHATEVRTADNLIWRTLKTLIQPLELCFGDAIVQSLRLLLVRLCGCRGNRLVLNVSMAIAAGKVDKRHLD